MPTLEWLKKEFDYGYDSGDILRRIPDRIRRGEERKIGGSYRNVFNRAIRPHLRPDSTVLELGPGRGSWSRAILQSIPNGRLITVDFQDVTPWLKPEQFSGRLVCHRVADTSFRQIADQSIDFFWSMGVLCHHNQNHIAEILANSLSKLKPGGVAIHQYGDWKKLDRYGWRRGAIPLEFRSQSDDDIWWPRNTRSEMCSIAAQAGWHVESPDLKLLRRDGLIFLRRTLSEVRSRSRAA
jgi:SAM-dependent methyltransferase